MPFLWRGEAPEVTPGSRVCLDRKPTTLPTSVGCPRFRLCAVQRSKGVGISFPVLLSCTNIVSYPFSTPSPAHRILEAAVGVTEDRFPR